EIIMSVLTIRRVEDGIVDPGTGKKTGKLVTVNRPGNPIFLVKDAEMLKLGPAPTIYRGGRTEKHELIDGWSLKSRKTFRLKLGEREYQLKVTGREYLSKEDPTQEAHSFFPLRQSRDNTSKRLPSSIRLAVNRR